MSWLDQYGWIIILGVVVIFTAITIAFYYRIDKYEPESLRRIAFAFGLGILSVIPALVMSLMVQGIIGSTLLLTVIGAPVTEELAKLWMVIYLGRDRRHFDGVIDGFLYGAVVGAGFAAAENLLYGFSALSSGGIVSGLALTTFRSLSMLLGHPLYTGLAGAGVGAYYKGMAKSEYNQLWRAIVLHGMWNLSASLFGIAFYVCLAIVIVACILILRNEIIMARELDKMAFESGYYQRKQEFIDREAQMAMQREQQRQNYLEKQQVYARYAETQRSKGLVPVPFNVFFSQGMHLTNVSDPIIPEVNPDEPAPEDPEEEDVDIEDPSMYR